MCLDLFGSVVSVLKKLKFLTGGEKALEINRDEVYTYMLGYMVG